MMTAKPTPLTEADWQWLAVALAEASGIAIPTLTQPDPLKLGVPQASPAQRTLYHKLAIEAGHRYWPSGQCVRCGEHCSLRTVVLTRLTDQMRLLRDLGLLDREAVAELLDGTAARRREAADAHTQLSEELDCE